MNRIIERNAKQAGLHPNAFLIEILMDHYAEHEPAYASQDREKKQEPEERKRRIEYAIKRGEKQADVARREKVSRSYVCQIAKLLK